MGIKAQRGENHFPYVEGDFVHNANLRGRWQNSPFIFIKPKGVLLGRLLIQVTTHMPRELFSNKQCHILNL